MPECPECTRGIRPQNFIKFISPILKYAKNSLASFSSGHDVVPTNQ